MTDLDSFFQDLDSWEDVPMASGLDSVPPGPLQVIGGSNLTSQHYFQDKGPDNKPALIAHLSGIGDLQHPHDAHPASSAPAPQVASPENLPDTGNLKKRKRGEKKKEKKRRVRKPLE